jgi:hypothetical protein
MPRCEQILPRPVGQRKTPIDVGLSEHLGSVHVAEGIGDEFYSSAVGVAKVQRCPLCSATSTSAAASLSSNCCHRACSIADRVMQSAEDLVVLLEVQTGEIEERQEVCVAARGRVTPGVPRSVPRRPTTSRKAADASTHLGLTTWTYRLQGNRPRHANAVAAALHTSGQPFDTFRVH